MVVMCAARDSFRASGTRREAAPPLLSRFSTSARLLGEQAPRAGGRACIACFVCGGAVVPEPGAYRVARRTCGEACNRELRRRNPIAARAAHRGVPAAGHVAAPG